MNEAGGRESIPPDDLRFFDNSFWVRRWKRPLNDVHLYPITPLILIIPMTCAVRFECILPDFGCGGTALSNPWFGYSILR